MNFKRIKEICEKKRISIPELARRIDISKAGLYGAIKNETLRIDTLERIAETLDVPITVFFSDEQSGDTEVPEHIKQLKATINDLVELYDLHRRFCTLVSLNYKNLRKSVDSMTSEEMTINKQIEVFGAYIETFVSERSQVYKDDETLIDGIKRALMI